MNRNINSILSCNIFLTEKAQDMGFGKTMAKFEKKNSERWERYVVWTFPTNYIKHPIKIIDGSN